MTLFHYMYVCYLQMAPGRLTRSQGVASIPVVRSTVRSTVQSTETPPKANPPAQSSSSTEAQTTGTLTSMTGNYIEYTYLQLHSIFTIEIILHLI